MINCLTDKHQQKIALFLFLLFYTSIVFAGAHTPLTVNEMSYAGNINTGTTLKKNKSILLNKRIKASDAVYFNVNASTKNAFIGGPTQPEMSSFKTVGTDNMVNLFSGDFSYNIPLLDVGGYPVNIFYNGGITMEQEASWVGLGWNINPGNINRNMRGVPDDFDGTDTLEQVQKVRKNRTWGFNVGGDFELTGIKALAKLFAGRTIGMSFNNKLGPSMELSQTSSLSISLLPQKVVSEKSSLSANLSLTGSLSSRNGFTLSGKAGLSLSAQMFKNSSTATFGVGLSTSYNSRSGIKALQISEQASFNNNQKLKIGDKERIYSDNLKPTLFANSISFAKPSYIPSIRMPLTNTSWSGKLQLGLGGSGAAVDIQTDVYGQYSEIDDGDTLQKKPLVGYLYYQNAVYNSSAVMDFTRFNDAEVTPNTPIISAPQYTYDVFSIQGEGTGGSVRAYRNDLGYVRDNLTVSKDKSIGVGTDLDPWGHFGVNIDLTKTPSTSGEWVSGNFLKLSQPFRNVNGSYENVFFRNPGENSVINNNQYIGIGGDSLVRYQLGGTDDNPSILPRLEKFNNQGSNVGVINTFENAERKKRTQVISFLSAAEASKVGLDVKIKSYNPDTLLTNYGNLKYETFDRIGDYRKANHISQINVTESNGKRYVYGIPVYNITQKDFTFSVDNPSTEIPDKVSVTDPRQMTTSSSMLQVNSNKDGYVQITKTPAYAHSFLLSGLLSSDYVDVTGDGITEDDLGDAIKFNYSMIKSGNARAVHKWRTPHTMGDSANFNAGNRTEIKDDKGLVSYGERESWYLHSIESKTMMAVFFLSNRADGKGAVGVDGGIDNSENSIKKLDSIALFSKADLRTNGISKAKAIKTVHFTYSYKLCQGTPDNPSGDINGDKGKLTLTSIYFTFNGKTRANKNKYVFSYNESSATDNPPYIFAAADRWGTYKPASINPSGLRNNDYPYTLQDSSNRANNNQYAAAWMLKKILLPSGGQLEVNYESDDYAYVQNKQAASMMKIVGFSNNDTAITNRLYNLSSSNSENDYVFIKVPSACINSADVYNKYLTGLSQLSMKIMVLMPKGYEYLHCYANFSSTNSYGVLKSNHNIIWVKMDEVGGMNPVALTALEHLRQQLPGQAFGAYDIADESTLKQLADMFGQLLVNLKNAFTDPVNVMRSDSKARYVDTTKCFVRLNIPDGCKQGGGYRVKKITLKDNWQVMTKQYTSVYGQEYDYTTTEINNGIARKISSGVASYEPSIGGEENPFQSIIQIQDKLPLGPASYGAVEMPVLDAFFPAPSVGYSKVTVRPLNKNTDTTRKSRSGIGKQVTEYYTAKDYPVYYSNTSLDQKAIKEYHESDLLSFFHKEAYDLKALTQGFLVATNDMHGKMKSQSSYAENDSTTRINYTENFYRNTGKSGLNEKFDFVDNENQAAVIKGNMGVDIELMTDVREFSVKTSSSEKQVNLEYFPILPPVFLWLLLIWPINGYSENTYRAVTTTKVISYHAIADSVVVIDKGSQVSTKNLVYDAQTGEVIVNRTNNEYNKPVYNTSYPAYWAYKAMGPAYKNINVVYNGISFDRNGMLSGNNLNLNDFESGDELMITNQGASGSGCDAQFSSGNTAIVWALDKNKNNPAYNGTPNFIFIDSAGKPFTKANVSFRIIRSGKRNMLDAKIGNITTMANPIINISGINRLLINNTSLAINAAAAEFREKWQVDNDVIGKRSMVYDPNSCSYYEIEDCNGYLEKNINPYRKGLIGNYRPYRNMVYYSARTETNPAIATNIAKNGFLNNFSFYWQYNNSAVMLPDITNTNWVWNNQLTKINARGLELETKNALNIYTAAQYGYSKALPTAITNNARYNEAVFEGFEDLNYNDKLSSSYSNGCAKRHISFDNLDTNNKIVNTDSLGFRAHSGKNVLQVGSNYNLQIPIASVKDSCSLYTTTDTTKSLYDIGVNVDSSSFNPNVNWYPNNNSYILNGIIPYTPTGLSFTVNPIDNINDGIRNHKFEVYTSHFINVVQSGVYNLHMVTSDENSDHSESSYMHIEIFDSIGNYITGREIGYSYYYSGINYYSSQTYPVFLCKGKYKIVGTYKNRYPNGIIYYDYYDENNNPHYYNGQIVHDVYFNYFFDNLNSQLYKSLSTQNGCSYTKPIAATDSMLNPVFSMPAGKKMVFSAWVREDCGNALPCRKVSYDSNYVLINDGITPLVIKPTGPIIDGWQRYEGYFTAAANATNINLSFNGQTGRPIYFDDIRMHPFNANMKSYVYDPISLRLLAELDANNYAVFYEYDEEGTLIRTKAETKEGIKTIKETRSAKQKKIDTLQ